MKRLWTILICAIVVFGVLSVGTSWYALGEAKSAIASIGTVSLNADSRQKIDTASTYYEALSVGIGASTYFHDDIDEYVNYPTLEQARLEYITQAIDHAYSLSLESDDFEQSLTDAIIEAREVLEAYFPSQDYSPIENYDLLLELENR